MKISDGVNKAIDLIEENLSNKNLDINFLAKELFLSPYYFQRAFCFAVQKSVGAYIRERRLTEAGTDIKLGAGILDTALKYGYDSQEAFSRAFKVFHGVTPGKAREGVILSCCPKINTVALLNGGIKMDIKIEREKGFTIAVWERTFNAQTSNKDVPLFWDEYYANGFDKIVPPMLGVCIDPCIKAGANEDEFVYGIGSVKEYCTSVPDGFKTYEIPPRLWGKFYTRGKMPDTIQKLWCEVAAWVEDSKYKIIPGFDFECYTEGDTQSENYESGIWVALEEK